MPGYDSPRWSSFDPAAPANDAFVEWFAENALTYDWTKCRVILVDKSGVTIPSPLVKRATASEIAVQLELHPYTEVAERSSYTGAVVVVEGMYFREIEFSPSLLLLAGDTFNFSLMFKVS